MNSLQQRLVWGVSTVVAASFAGLGILTGLLTTQSLSRDIDRLVQDRAVLVAATMNNRHQPSYENWMDARMQPAQRGFAVQVVDRHGQFRGKSLNLPEPLPFTASLQRENPDLYGVAAVATETVRDTRGELWRVASYPVYVGTNAGLQVTGYALAAVPLREQNTHLRRLLLGLVAGSLLGLTATIVLVRLLIKHWLRSLTAATTSAQVLSTENLGRQRLFVPDDDAEIARLARAFNELLDRLEAAHATQQRFIADASHELRTPLTILKGEIEVALRRDRTAAEFREVLQSNREEIERLNRLAENLLTLARADAGEVLAAREPVDVGALCEEVCTRLQPLARARDVTLNVETAVHRPIPADPVALDRVVFNLVENAVRFTPAGERVCVRSESDDAGVRIVVSDTGAGIAQEHLPRLFDRFYRVDAARTRSQGGAGLGLAIVQCLVQAHGGRIEVRSEVGQGTAFTVWLPQHLPPRQEP